MAFSLSLEKNLVFCVLDFLQFFRCGRQVQRNARDVQVTPVHGSSLAHLGYAPAHAHDGLRHPFLLCQAALLSLAPRGAARAPAARVARHQAADLGGGEAEEDAVGQTLQIVPGRLAHTQERWALVWLIMSQIYWTRQKQDEREVGSYLKNCLLRLNFNRQKVEVRRRECQTETKDAHRCRIATVLTITGYLPW